MSAPMPVIAAPDLPVRVGGDTPLVVDLAYGDVVIDAGAGGSGNVVGEQRRFDVTVLLDAIDSAVVTVGGETRATAQLWREMLFSVGRGAPDRPVVLGHPSTWGSVRCGVLARAASCLRVPVSLVPRAVLIARSHSDTVMSNCVIVETTHRPAYPTDTTPPTWDVQRMARTSSGWKVAGSGVITHTVDERVHAIGAAAGGPADTGIGQRIVALIDDSVEAVFVDGADPAQVRAAIEEICAYTVAGRVVAVDRGLVRRHGSRTAVIAPLPETPPALPGNAAEQQSWAHRNRLPIAGLAALLVALLAIGFFAFDVTGRRNEEPPTAPYREATVGRTTLSVPAGWHQSTPPKPADQTDRGAAQTRSVFTDPSTGSRILLVQSDVRSASTLGSVANSLRNRIGQRGDDVVIEFSASTRFGDREVIAYREAPASGSAIRWYVLVDDDLQVSVGCQAGSTGEPVDVECARAVSTVRIGR